MSAPLASRFQTLRQKQQMEEALSTDQRVWFILFSENHIWCYTFKNIFFRFHFRARYQDQFIHCRNHLLLISQLSDEEKGIIPPLHAFHARAFGSCSLCLFLFFPHQHTRKWLLAKFTLFVVIQSTLCGAISKHQVMGALRAQVALLRHQGNSLHVKPNSGHNGPGSL